MGIAVAVGMGQFSTSAYIANQDSVISDLVHLSSLARAHYYRPVSLGGGGNSFANFEIPPALLQNDNGTYEHTKAGHKSDHIHFEGTGTEMGEDGKPLVIEARITIDEIKIKVKKPKKAKK